MSKAILVIDMPKSCDKCDLGLQYGSICCVIGNTYSLNGTKSCECPLKPLGQKVEEYGLETWNTRDGIFLCEKGLFDEIYGDEEE